MARYTKSSYRVSRRLGFSTLETGEELARRPYAPGAHGNKKAKKIVHSFPWTYLFTF